MIRYCILFISSGDQSSRHLTTSIENSSKQIPVNSIVASKSKFQSKSFEDLRLRPQNQQNNDNHVSNGTRTEMDLSTIGCNENRIFDEKKLYYDDEHDPQEQKSQSAPVSPTKVYDKELATFIQCEQQLITDSFIYNIDLSNTNEATHQPQTRATIFNVCGLVNVSCYYVLVKKRNPYPFFKMIIFIAT